MNSRGRDGLAQVPTGDQLGHNADGDFIDGLRADGESQGRMDLAQTFGRNTFGHKVFVDQLDLALTADHADVTRGRPDQMIEGLFIMCMAASHNDTKGARRDVLGKKLLKLATDVADQNSLGTGETLATGIGLAVVQDPDVEVNVSRQPSDRLSHVATAD